MLKKIFLSIITLSVCFCCGCQNIVSLFDEQNAITVSSKNTTAKAECVSWIYVPSTRTIKNTMTSYSSPLEFTVNDVTVTEHLQIGRAHV